MKCLWFLTLPMQIQLMLLLKRNFLSAFYRFSSCQHFHYFQGIHRGREFAIGCYLYNLFIYATWGVAKWAKEVQSLDS